MGDEESLLERISDLRSAGLTPKQIARAVRLRPAQVAPLVRAAAARAAGSAGEVALVGCWVNPGWSGGLRIAGRPDWSDLSPDEQIAGGMATVVVARRHRPSRVSVCGYLVDTHCLGVKNTLGPRVMGDGDLPAFLRMFFQPFEHLGPPLAAPLELARHLVYGAVYAAGGSASNRPPTSPPRPTTWAPGRTKARSPSAATASPTTWQAPTTTRQPCSAR